MPRSLFRPLLAFLCIYRWSWGLQPTGYEKMAPPGAQPPSYFTTVEPQVLCNVTKAFPKLTTIATNPWNCSVALKTANSWCSWNGVTCRPGRGNQPIIYLNLSSRSLSGRIPSYLGQLVTLQSLALDHNSLSGQIPSALSNLKSLEILRLDKNFLTGTVPRSFNNMTSLRILNVNYNYLSGALSGSLLSRTNSTDDQIISSGPAPKFVQITRPTGQPTSMPTHNATKTQPKDTSTSTKSGSSSLSDGQIAGAVIGSVVGAGLVSGAVYYYVVPSLMDPTRGGGTDKNLLV
jgi:Leucine rich repeat